MSKQTQKFLKNIQESLYHQQLTYLQSPQLLSHIVNLKKSDYPSQLYKTQEINLEQLLLSTHGPSIKKINDSRERYRQIKQKIANCMKALQNNQQLSLSQIVQWKQTILTTFLNRFLVQISKQCKQKSQILVYIWNTVFNIMDYLLNTVSKMGQRDQKNYLEAILKNHQSYQTMMDNLRTKLNKKEEQRKKQEEFIKILVYNLRYKRKEIKKLSKNLKLCTVKLNQFKDFYLDLQLEHIQLLSENRDISKENALNLLKRKQEINHQKRKEFKLKQSRKRIRFQIQNQIQNQNKHQGDNVNKLNDELQTAFNKYYSDQKNNKSITKIQKVAQNLFQNALDDFTVRIDDIPETQTIIDFKNNTAFVDMATDMADFVRDVEQREVQITFNDRLHEDMILHAAVQTVEIKPKLKVYEEVGIQLQQIQLKILKLTKVNKVIDRSYILEDYRDRDRRFKIQTKTKTEQYLKSMREIHYYDDNKKTVELLDYELESNGQVSKSNAEVQTDQAWIFNFASIPNKLRNRIFEKEILKYVEQVKKLQLEWQKNGDSEENSSTSKNWLKKSYRKNYLSDTIQNNRQLRDKSFQSSSYRNGEGSASKLPTTRLINRNKISLQQRNTSTIRRSKNLNQNMLQIKESIFQQLKSRNKKDQQEGLNTTNNKFWVNKKNIQELSKDKKQFLFDLNLGDKLMNKFNSNFQYTPQNKRLITELEKISQQLTNNKSLFELLENNISQNIHILKEQLRKMNKKKNNRKLPISRLKSLTKIISLVYTYAYHFYLNHQKPLINLIIPLFHYFKIGYGQIKKNDLYLRMLYFLSQTVCHKQECYIFQSFILFLGLNLDQGPKIKIGKENTCLYLKLLSRLSVNFKFPLNVEELYTTLELLDDKCREILRQLKYEQEIIEKVIERVKLKLHSLINQGQSYSNIENECVQVKINVFKCCQFIIQELQKIKNTVYQSYTQIYHYFTYIQGVSKEMFQGYIFKNLYLGKQQKRNKSKWFQAQLKDSKAFSAQTYLYKVVGMFLQLSIVDFNKMYFMALAKYRIKQQFLYLSINRRFNFFVKYIDMHRQQMHIENALIKHLLHNKEQRDEKQITKQVMNKKIMGLAYLQIIQIQAEKVLNLMLGDNLAQLYG